MGGLLAAIAVSWTGTRVSTVALPWFVLATTGSVTRMGLVAFCEMTPYVLVKALAGPLTDRVGPRTVSWTTDLVSAGTAAAIPMLQTCGALTFPTLLGLVSMIGTARGPGDLAKAVMVPAVAELTAMPTARAAGLAGVTERLATTTGPAIGGALVALLGPLAGLAVNAACFTLGSVIVALVLPRDLGRSSPPRISRHWSGSAHAGREETGYWRSFGEGLAFLVGDRLLLTIVVTVGATNLLDIAFTSVLLPVWARTSGHGAAVVGLNVSLLGAAAIAGSLIVTAVAHRLRRRLVCFAGFLLVGAPKFLVLAASAPTWAVCAVFTVSGFGAGFLNPILAAVLFERTPNRLLARVSSLSDSLGWVGVPLGGLLAGALVTALGLGLVLLTAAGAYFLITNLTALRPEWREMEQERQDDRHPDQSR
jgi:MFS family permease